MKTVEFKLNLNLDQQAKVDAWLSVQRWVWNQGLNLLEEFYLFHYWDKISKTWNSCCPIAWKYRKDENNWIPYCPIAHTCRDWVQCCPINQDFRESPIDSPNHFGLLYYFAQKNHPDKPWFVAVPSKFVAGTCKALTDAYDRFRKGDFGKIRFKRKQDKIHSLINNNAKDIKPADDYLRVPRLGLVKVKGLSDRWLNDVAISTLKICKGTEAYYLQLTGDLPAVSIKPSDKAVGLDFGLKSVLTTDTGKSVAPPRLYRQKQKRLRRLQRKVSRQVKGSNSQTRTYRQIGKLHEKIKRSRNAFNHKLSTKLVRKFGAIAVEDIQIKNLLRRPKPKKREDGKGYEHNGAKRKSGLNKSFADTALGDLKAKIESKAKANGREVALVAPHYTSVDCSRCGTEVNKALSTRTHRCLSCGLVIDRDENAARNILMKANFKGIYRTLVREVKPLKDGKKPSGQAEVGQPAPEERELSSQSLNMDERGGGDVDFLLLAPLSGNQGSVTLSISKKATASRAPYGEGLSTDSNRKQGKQKRTAAPTSAQTNSESYTQLELWDSAAETG